ncbi:MAG: hypothetical protein IT458_10805, partial [Planctomycetes bacterium]|nr:hypothetical protein [Planctomycetota bacterium]
SNPKEDLLRAAQTGDRGAFDRLMADEASALKDLLRRNLASAGLPTAGVEDAYQDVCLRALGALPTCAFVHYRAFQVWLQIIARNRARSLGRARRRAGQGRESEPADAASLGHRRRSSEARAFEFRTACGCRLLQAARPDGARETSPSRRKPHGWRNEHGRCRAARRVGVGAVERSPRTTRSGRVDTSAQRAADQGGAAAWSGGVVVRVRSGASGVPRGSLLGKALEGDGNLRGVGAGRGG